jgi:hypothetical protein
MNINFERLRLQMLMRKLYEDLGAMDAELLIVDAFVREQTRHEQMHQQQDSTSSCVRQPGSKHLTF